MKTLIIYHNNSLHKFEEAYQKFLFEMDGEILKVFKRCPTSGEETLHAAFRNWDYYILEEEI